MAPSVSPALRAAWALLCIPLLSEWLVDMLRKGKDFFFLFFYAFSRGGVREELSCSVFSLPVVWLSPGGNRDSAGSQVITSSSNN